jgi:hypothetical protein
MVFGYLNRNHIEELSIPIGTRNSFEPGPADRGQPGYFLPRENRFLFKVNVPKDWGKKELVWTVTAHGKTEKARATLQDIWEIDRKNEIANSGGGTSITDELIAKNQPPTVKIDPASRASVGTPINLSASVTDDGIPPKSDRPRERPRGEPTLQGAPASPVNVPLPVAPKPVRGALSVWWIVYRGPAAATFKPDGYSEAKNGKATVAVTFNEPGTYVLRAIASDSLIRSMDDVTITVQ